MKHSPLHCNCIHERSISTGALKNWSKENERRELWESWSSSFWQLKCECACCFDSFSLKKKSSNGGMVTRANCHLPLSSYTPVCKTTSCRVPIVLNSNSHFILGLFYSSFAYCWFAVESHFYSSSCRASVYYLCASSWSTHSSCLNSTFFWSPRHHINNIHTY